MTGHSDFLFAADYDKNRPSDRVHVGQVHH